MNELDLFLMGMVNDWLKHSACSLEDMGWSLVWESYCVGTLSKSFSDINAQLLSIVLSHDRVCTSQPWREDNFDTQLYNV